MNRKTAWLLASFFGMTATSYLIEARSSETPTQTQRAASQQPTRPDGARRFTDMYSVTWQEIPMPESTPADPHIITADSITNDGTIAGVGTGALVFWHPDTQAWEDVPKELDGWPVFISPDGSSIVTTDYAQTPNPTNILTWNRAAGWQTLAESTVTQSGANNVSRNFRFAVGGGNNNGEAAQAWVWTIDGGVQQLLPTPHSDGVVAALAMAVSDNGDVVIGNAIRPTQSDGFFWNAYVATRWAGGEHPTILRDPDGNELPTASACNADCSIVFGSGPWFLNDNGEFGFLGTLPDGYPWIDDPYGPYAVTDASADGSLVVGLYLAKAYPEIPRSEVYIERPYIWTQATGMISLRSLLTELSIGGDDWGNIRTVRLSPDGRCILISGEHGAAANQWAYDRVGVLHLTPKTAMPRAGHSTRARPIPPPSDRNWFLRAGSDTAVD